MMENLNNIPSLDSINLELLDRIVEEAHQDSNADKNTEIIHQEIPVNSETLLVDTATSRFSSAIWYDNIKSKNIVVAGCGGIGSYVIYLLSRMKPYRLVIYDNDKVEEANMSGQLYGKEDLELPKVVAISKLVQNFSNYYNIIAYNERFTSDCLPYDIMICGFDNMSAREVYFNSWKSRLNNLGEEDKKKCLYIDGRLAAEEFQILCIKGDDDYNIKRYQEEFLFSDEEADETICSYKQTTFCANMIASCMVNLFVNFCANEMNPLIERDLPFLTTYNAETMFFKTIK